MKKTIFIVLAALIGVELSAFADTEQAQNLSPLQKAQITWAIKILGETKTLITNQNHFVQFDQDILNVLEEDRQILRGGAQPNVICVGSEK